MKKWSDDEGTEFRNSDICYGREYSPGSGTIDVAKISIRGEFPGEGKYGYLEPMERFRWGGNMDLIVPCGPAFDPSKHKIEEA